jgi:hypothetical protein
MLGIYDESIGSTRTGINTGRLQPMDCHDAPSGPGRIVENPSMFRVPLGRLQVPDFSRHGGLLDVTKVVIGG